ncbi:molybdopterin-dependent oxidoreductase [Spirillospora albida]|uniref:molybdopterin-dependent oxidoreductase n=1 Tax=Spirillospora albida TaxID=58123 RepID=UPI000A48FB6C|nr:molybdopterin-dependent oxidoreductase [Spirillospora albida]
MSVREGPAGQHRVEHPVSPRELDQYRDRLSRGGDAVDLEKWSGSLPAASGIAPRIRVGRNKWFNLLWLVPIGWALLLVAVAVAQELREHMAGFIERHPGTLPVSAAAEPGMPWWAAVQHFVNLVFMLFIIRSGIQILADHARLYWTRHSTPGKDWFRFQKPVPEDPLWTAKQDSVTLPKHFGLPGLRHSIGLARWWHLGLDVLWLVNGIVFYVLLFSTGHWRRIVPTSWEVFPSAVSVLIQYMSLDWPVESGWTAFNSLQMLAYFVTVFIAAPLALITGLGMSPALSTRIKPVSRVLSIQVARSLHFLVMVWFVLFIVVHVTLVFTTGLRRNLNHIYAGRDDTSWIGLAVFAVVLALLIAAWVAATPFTLKYPRLVQRVGSALVRPIQRLFQHVDATPGQYTEKDISPYFWHNGAFPRTPEYKAMFDEGFASWRLKVHGLVEHPVELSLSDLRALPRHEQITQHFCVQGWSGIAKWGGVSMSTILDLVQPHPEAKWVVFYSLGDGPSGGLYYDVHPIEQMRYRLTMLAYDMNDEPLTYGHGAPLRLRNEIQHGFKQVKWIAGIDFVASFADVAGGYGGYNADHEFFGYVHTI